MKMIVIAITENANSNECMRTNTKNRYGETNGGESDIID